MGTGARGEGYLELDGERYPILFTLRAIAEAEAATGKTVLQLMREAQTNTMGVGDLARLLAVGLEHARREGRGRVGGAEQAWALLERLGFMPVAVIVFEALAAAMSYGGAGRDGPPA